MPRVLPGPPEILSNAPSADSARRFPNFAWIALAYNVAVVLEGAFVRATGSGAGCGNHWPLCSGQLVFGTPALATLIELAHRSMTGIDTVLILWLLVWAFRAFPKHHAVRMGAALSTLFLITEALIGAALVKFGLVVNDASPARAAVLSLHLTNTLTLLACLTLTAWWAGHPRSRVSGRAAWMAWCSLAAVAVLGITGVLAALADTLYPVRSLAAGFAQDLSPDANFAVRLRAVHPFLAAAVALWLVYYAMWRVADARKPALAVIAMVSAQLLAGVLNLLLLAPVWMQILHLLLADLLWIALVVLCVHSSRGSTQRRFP
jgi:heme A synthase